MSMIPKLWWACESPGSLVENVHPESQCFGWDLKFYISNKLTAETSSAGLQTVLRVANIDFSILIGNYSAPEKCSEGLLLRHFWAEHG